MQRGTPRSGPGSCLVASCSPAPAPCHGHSLSFLRGRRTVVHHPAAGKRMVAGRRLATAHPQGVWRACSLTDSLGRASCTLYHRFRWVSTVRSPPLRLASCSGSCTGTALTTLVPGSDPIRFLSRPPRPYYDLYITCINVLSVALYFYTNDYGVILSPSATSQCARAPFYSRVPPRNKLSPMPQMLSYGL